MIFRNVVPYYVHFLTVNVAMMCVTPMDRHGYFNLSCSTGVAKGILNMADIVILEINDRLPRIYGGFDERIHISEVGKSGIMHEQLPVIAIGRYGTSDIFDPPPVEGRQSKRPTVMWMIGAQAAIVKVNPVTGRVQLVKMGASNDIGKAINPTGILQQVEGSVIMGLGHTIMEEMIYEDGNLRNGNMVDYKVPTFMDSDVDIKVTMVEKGHPEGPYGVKGIGEPGLVPTAAAIASAISHASNTDFDSLPIKPEHILFRKEVAD